MNTNRYIGLFFTQIVSLHGKKSNWTLSVYDLDTQDGLFYGEFSLSNDHATKRIFPSLMTWTNSSSVGNRPNLWFFVRGKEQILKEFANVGREKIAQDWIDFDAFREQVAQRASLAPLEDLPEKEGQSASEYRYANTLHMRGLFQETLRASFDYGGPHEFLGDASVKAPSEPLQRVC